MLLDAVNRFKNWSQLNRGGIVTAVRNISWLSADNFVNIAVSAAVSVVVARTLGPEAIGTWGYVFAIYSVALILISLGTDQILLVDLVNANQPRGTIMTTALLLRLGTALLVSIALVAASLLSRDSAPHENALMRLLSLALIVMAFDVNGNSFRSQRRFDLVAIPSMLATVVGGVIKIWLVVRTGSILPLGAITVIQSVLLQGFLGFNAYRNSPQSVFGRFSARYARELTRTSLPLMLSSLAVFVYLRANIFFVNAYGGKVNVGLYNAAAAISGLAYFVPMVIVTTFTPALYRRYNDDRASFEQVFAHLTNLLTVGLFCISCVVTLFADRIIVLLYGPSFRPAAAVLALNVWTLIPVAFGLTSSVWLGAGKRTGVLLSRTLCGCAVNLALNMVLVPRFGILGAAVATLAAMFVASTLTLLFYGPEARQIFRVQVRALLLVDLAATVFGTRRSTIK
jgi:polysaccharide transporter, PST family